MSAAKRRDAVWMIQAGGWVELVSPQDGSRVAGPYHDEAALLAALALHPDAVARLHLTPLRVLTKTP